MNEEGAQDPRVGSYPYADEANKWGLWRDAFAAHRAEARQFHDEERRTSWCQPYFRTLIEEFLYVWQHDERFLECYKPYGTPENPYSGKIPNVAEMGFILGWLKDCLSRHRRLWGYERLVQGSTPRKLLKPRNGNGAH